MKHKLLFITLLIGSFTLSYCQADTVFNQTDGKGQKQGYWKKSYPNGKLMYTGKFVNNKPVGLMQRYYETGEIQAIINFHGNNDESTVKLFYDTGELSAQGKFIGSVKDSTWLYYSYYTGALVSEEHYSEGRKTGIQRSFYPNGKISEEIEYQNDIKQGIWNQYFEDGILKLKASNMLNMVNGRYTFYYPNAVMMLIGNFVDNKRNGVWVFYSEDGKEKYRITYQMGNISSQDEQKLIDQDKEFFKSVDENIGKFDDPSIEEFYKGPF